jgi:hypothetical protein
VAVQYPKQYETNQLANPYPHADLTEQPHRFQGEDLLRFVLPVDGKKEVVPVSNISESLLPYKIQKRRKGEERNV